jgi:recombination associated protein RdgC
MRDLRLRVADELRARALVRRRVTHAWLDREHGWLVVDAAGPGRAEERAEEVVEMLRETLGQFAATTADTASSARVAMGSWLAAGEAGRPFTIDDDVEVKRVEFMELESAAADAPDVDPLEQFDIDFTVMSGELAHLLTDLVAALGGEPSVAAAGEAVAA